MNLTNLNRSIPIMNNLNVFYIHHDAIVEHDVLTELHSIKSFITQSM